MREKILLSFIIVLFVIGFAYSEQLNNYNIEIVARIESGSSEGEIGFDIYPEGPVVPYTLAINDKGYLYIPDPLNNRMNIFDKNLKAIEILNEKKKGRLHWAEFLFVDKAGNILYLNTSIGLRKIDKHGNEIFTIRPQLLSDYIMGIKNIHIVDEFIFLYNDDQEIEMLSDKGMREPHTVIIQKLQKLSESLINKASSLSDNFKLSDNALAIIQSIRETGKFLLVGDRFYSNNFKQHQDYYEKISSIREQARAFREKNNILQKKNVNRQEPVDINIDTYYHFFIGYDDDHNSYWQFESKKEMNGTRKQVIVVYSKYGELLDAFQYGVLTSYEPNLKQYPTSGAKVAVAPNGAVWFMRGSAKGYFFYKIDRQW